MDQADLLTLRKVEKYDKLFIKSFCSSATNTMPLSVLS